MAKAKSVAQKIFNLKISEQQRQFIKITAKAQGHTNLSLVVKRWIDREMHRTDPRLSA